MLFNRTLGLPPASTGPGCKAPAHMRIFPPALILAVAPLASGADSAASSDAALARSFGGTTRPFLQTYCVTCHSGAKPPGDLDLSAYRSLTAVTNDLARWKLVLDRLTAGDMPPDEAKLHPTPAQRKPVVDWITRVVAEDNQRHAGDPGLVLARRLSNAEYDHTIRDLTGVDLQPTSEFPVDPANQEGFDNTGESLMMSPTLWKKYYQAAVAVADTLVLQPEGFAFAPHPMLVDTDREKYSVLRIVAFYQRQPTDYADYFAAAWRFQHRAELGVPQATLPAIAQDGKISAKYLAAVWAALNDSGEQVGPLARVQTLWRAWPPPAQTDAAGIHARAAGLRDFVVRLRDKLVPVVPNLSAGLLGPGSQPMVLLKDRQMAANRRRYDPTVLQVGTPPALVTDLKDVGIAAAVAAPAAPPNLAVSAVTAASQAPVAVVNPTPKAGVKLPQGLGTPVAPIAKTAADGRTRSALEIADLALAAQPARQVGGPLPKTPDIVKFGGVFLDAQVKTTGSSVTTRMAEAAKHHGEKDPDLFVPADPAERARYEAAFAHFADLFPDAFYISERARVYLDPEVEESLEGRLLSAGLHSQTGYFRDDTPLSDLILDDAGRRELDQLWDTFNFNAAIPARMLTSFLYAERGALHDAEFDQYRPENQAVTTQPMIKSLTDLLVEKVVAGGQASPAALAAVKDHFARVAANNLWLDRTREAAEPGHLQALLDFAERAYRRPLTPKDRADLLAFYQLSRTENGLDHEDAMRDCIVRVLMSPYFLYRLDLNADPANGTAADPGQSPRVQVVPVAMFPGGPRRAGSRAAPAEEAPGLPAGTRPLTDYELASRLSYFLWSTMPDAELKAHAAAGDLHRPEVLAAQARRMLQSDHLRDFAVEFGGNWLDFRRFEETNTVDRERFPAFNNDLREAMFQEPVRFMVDLVQTDRPVLDFLYGDHTFVNPVLAKHYGIPGVTGDPDHWVRVDHVGDYQRGGLLPMAVFLTANSPGLRTSPVKRGNWVVRRLLGERIPAPPPNVPVLPSDETKLGDLTLAQALARHHTDPNCAGCHEKFDAFGLVFEGYGPVGEVRTKDLADRPVQINARFPDGTEETGLEGLRAYLRTKVQGEFLDNLCRKLLAYGLGRTLLPSDDALVAEMRTRLAGDGQRFGAMVDVIVASPQFRSKRVAAGPTQVAAGNN
jgi:hypothetical protein